MKVNLPSKYLILSIIGGALVSPPALAQPESALDRSKPWANACENAVTDLVISDHPRVERLQFLGDTEYQYQASNAEVGVHGEAETRRSGVNARWHQFTFSCTYNQRRGRVTDVTYDIHGVNYE